METRPKRFFFSLKYHQAYKLQDAKITSCKNIPKYPPYIGIMLRDVALRVYLLFFLGGGGQVSESCEK